MRKFRTDLKYIALIRLGRYKPSEQRRGFLKELRAAEKYAAKHGLEMVGVDCLWDYPGGWVLIDEQTSDYTSFTM
jgi:hypothetical protein